MNIIIISYSRHKYSYVFSKDYPSQANSFNSFIQRRKSTLPQDHHFKSK